jgi:ribosome-binding protein aMBF1 (putative translation factor)
MSESKEPTIECPHCHGKGESMAFVCGTRCDYRAVKCSTCKGTGRVTAQQIEMMKEGEIIRRDRIARGLSIREEAARLNVDFPEWSRIEAGRLPETNAGHSALEARRSELALALAEKES